MGQIRDKIMLNETQLGAKFVTCTKLGLQKVKCTKLGNKKALRV